MISAFAFQTLYPILNHSPALGWRALFWIGALPAFLVVWVWYRVDESPVWLARQGQLKQGRRQDTLSLVAIFRRDLVGVTLQTSVLMIAFMFSYYSITFWYPTYLRESQLQPLPYLVALNVG